MKRSVVDGAVGVDGGNCGCGGSVYINISIKQQRQTIQNITKAITKKH